jgi:chemotaxis protein MotA
VRKLDLATLLGLSSGLGFILVGNHLEGGHLSSIIQPTAALIVFGGTLGAVLVSFPLNQFMSAVKGMKNLFGDEGQDPQALIDEIAEQAKIARRDGLLALEETVKHLKDPFLKKSLDMVVAGFDSKTLQETLDLALAEQDEQGEAPAKVFEAAGGYSPTIGIVGAVLGLIHVMSNLSDVSKVGAGIAVAFVATIYGVASANLLFLPAANKLKIKHRDHMRLCEMTQAGVLALQQGQSPRLIADRLAVFVGEHHGKAASSAGAKARSETKAAA